MKKNLLKHVIYMTQLLIMAFTLQCLSMSILHAGNAISPVKSIKAGNIHPKKSNKENVNNVVEYEEIKVSGTVTGENGEPIPGVTVSVPGTLIGTATDLEGNYTLAVLEGSTLVFSFIGFESRRVEVGDRSVIDIILNEDMSSLDEVVVVGYGEQKEANLTGAVSSVDIKNIGSRPATNVASLLQGQMAGVTITQSSGQPGQEGMNILIRGIGTMGDSQPMVIIDGMESSMANINPNDIENISVLKDAASSAIYGTRAANVVILITTKRGKTGSPEITYNTYIGQQQATRLPEYLSSDEYAKLLNEGHTNVGQNPRYTDE